MNQIGNVQDLDWLGVEPEPESETSMENGEQDKKRVTIIVNTRPHEWPAKEISYLEVYELAFPGEPLGGGVTVRIEYSHGPHGHNSGALTAGHSVEVKDGMVFDVHRTTAS